MNYEQLIQQKKLKFQEPVPEELKCLLCLNVLVNPYTVSCGHDYCLRCLQEHINNKNNNRHCVGNNDECKEEKLDSSRNFAQNFKAMVKIKKLKVECINIKCTEIIEIRNLEGHLKICKFRNEGCPFLVVGCNVKDIIREQLKQHLTEKAFDHANIMTKYVKDINNKNEELRKANVRLNQKMEHQLEFQNELENTKIDLSNKNEMIRNIEDELKEVKEQLNICIIENKKIKDNENKLKKENEQLNDLTNKIKESLTQKSFEWIVTDFVKKYEAAANKDDFHITSEPQYLCGCNTVLLLYPRRKTYLRGEYILVQFKFVPGIYDDMVNWPITKSISCSAVTWDNGGLYWPQNLANRGGEEYKKPVSNGNKLSDFYWLCRCSDILDGSKFLLEENKLKIKIWMK